MTSKKYEGFSNPIDVSTETLSCDLNQMTVTTVLGLMENEKKLPTNDINKVESQENEKSGHNCKEPVVENLFYMALQIFVPFLIAGIGTIGAGLVLGRVEDYEVFKNIKALYILVPAIIGLKGNLDMCLASRMCTQANLGTLDIRAELISMIIGNIFLVQVQAIVASCVVSLFAVSASAVLTGDFNFHDAMLLVASSTITATTSCFILDFVLIAVILLTRKLKMNPDNLATPLAASIGDVVSLIVLSTVASLLYEIHDKYFYIMFIIVGIYVLFLLPTWVMIVRKNKYTKTVLKEGWVPVISALFISGMGGLVLDSAVEDFTGFVVFQPIINGIGGNLVSIQSSRISTMLHQTSLPGIIPPYTKQWIMPWATFFSKMLSARTARLLVILSIPGQVVFVLVADVIYNNGELASTVYFVLTYLTVFIFQLSILLYVCHLLIHTMWRFKIDPDNSAIPFLTALGDLLGTCLLFAGFIFLKEIGHPYTPI
nr:solute carrier family 41 member 1-like [Onthophagus taurus]XP_022915621.1 solute carrier family 41 member 1-like [Onthophagus taurus]XP_022915622.1 solute carrier family 41 member 1-like [Onthophagus taurus]